MTSPGEVVTVFTSPYLSAGAPALGEAKGLIAIKINNKLKKDDALNKNREFLTITKSQVNRILKEKYGKPLKIRKVFYLNEAAKRKRLEFCQNIIQKGLEGKNIFFIDETKMDTAPNTKGESIRIFSQIKNKLKKGDEEGYKKINRETKKYEPSTIIGGEYLIMA